MMIQIQRIAYVRRCLMIIDGTIPLPGSLGKVQVHIASGKVKPICACFLSRFLTPMVFKTGVVISPSYRGYLLPLSKPKFQGTNLKPSAPPHSHTAISANAHLFKLRCGEMPTRFWDGKMCTCHPRVGCIFWRAEGTPRLEIWPRIRVGFRVMIHLSARLVLQRLPLQISRKNI
jgi:hypothetical protein